MLLIIVTMIVLNVLGQRIPDLFDKRDYEYRDFGQRNPYQGRDYQTKKPFKVDLSVFEKLDQQLEKYNKYEEFKEFTDQVKERTRMDPSRTVQHELKEVLQWSRNLERPPIYGRRPRVQNFPIPPLRPSPGMNPYYGETEQLTGRQVINNALRDLTNADAIDEKSPMERFPEIMKKLPKSLPTELLQAPIKPLFNSQTTSNVVHKLPEKDDYNSPIRWVSLISNDTRDGLAKVTDPRTGKNQQFILNETIFVPVRDYNMERLSINTTPRHPVLTENKRVLLTVARSIDLKTVDERDWLVFEIALGGRNESNQCNSNNNCQSRCKTPACESVCRGDTCASGCVGGFCNTFCKGPRCLSMCIGASCTAKCEGLSCDSRCRGDGCVADCRSLSCSYVINGRHGRGGGLRTDHYPQYDHKNIRNTQY